MAITTLLPDTSILIEHQVDVAVHPETLTPTRIATRPYHLRTRWPKGARPGIGSWGNYGHFKYRHHRDESVRRHLEYGYEVQAWDFPNTFHGPILKNREAAAQRVAECRTHLIYRDGRYWRWTEEAGWH